MGRGLAGACAGLIGLVAPTAALASNRLADADVRDPTLQVDRGGHALVSYTLPSGARRHVFVWGATDARTPQAGVRQVRLSFDYAGGYRLFRSGRAWKTLRNVCRPYDGPALAYFVAGCRAPDGSYWALQAWQRSLPLLGFAPWLASQSATELHVSHWRGPLADLDVHANWTYDGTFVGLFGRVTYAGVPVYGFAATGAGNPRDGYGRNVYVDTFNSAYGPGWAREVGILLHGPTGTFCHSFVPQRPPAGYPRDALRPAAPGRRFRVTVVGPGVTPDVEWEGEGLGPYDAAADARANAIFDSLMAGDARCARER
jgi:hypothetical protein